MLGFGRMGLGSLWGLGTPQEMHRTCSGPSLGVGEEQEAWSHPCQASRPLSTAECGHMGSWHVPSDKGHPAHRTWTT